MEAIRNSPISYTVRTSARRNDLSLEWQTLVAAALAVAIYGVLEDPQTGELEDFDKSIVESDEEPRRSWENTRTFALWGFFLFLCLSAIRPLSRALIRGPLGDLARVFVVTRASVYVVTMLIAALSAAMIGATVGYWRDRRDLG